MLIHGLIGSFDDQRALSSFRSTRVLAPDLVGYGAEASGRFAEISIDAQVDYLRALVSREVPRGRVHVVAHSVGAVIAASFIYRFPDRVASFVNCEGNFSLADAFWSAKLAAMPLEDVQRMLEADRKDPARWLRSSGVEPTKDRIQSAAAALSYQSAATIQAVARSVVDVTGKPAYEQLLRTVFQRCPVHLVAGARSAAGWQVPDWAHEAAASYTEIDGTGHLMMVEEPAATGAVLSRLLV